MIHQWYKTDGFCIPEILSGNPLLLNNYRALSGKRFSFVDYVISVRVSNEFCPGYFFKRYYLRLNYWVFGSSPRDYPVRLWLIHRGFLEARIRFPRNSLRGYERLFFRNKKRNALFSLLTRWNLFCPLKGNLSKSPVKKFSKYAAKSQKLLLEIAKKAFGLNVIIISSGTQKLYQNTAMQ